MTRFMLSLILVLPMLADACQLLGAVRTVYGQGGTSCGHVLVAHPSARLTYVAWIGGYLSGVGADGSRKSTDMDAAIE